jgi:uncharacterized membrane protein
MNRVELKAKAKECLNGKYSEAIIVMLIVGILSGLAGGITTLGDSLKNDFLVLIGNLGSIIIPILFTFGTLSFYLKISRDEEVTYQELFSKTNLFLPYIAISLITGIFTFLWSILLIIPGIIAAISYSQVYFIKLDNPDMSTLDCINESKRIMNGHKLDYFILNLSFLGWAILGIFTLGILYFWLIPYISVTQANFYNEIKEQ